MHLWKIAVNNQYTLIEQSLFKHNGTVETIHKYTPIKISFS